MFAGWWSMNYEVWCLHRLRVIPHINSDCMCALQCDYWTEATATWCSNNRTPTCIWVLINAASLHDILQNHNLHILSLHRVTEWHQLVLIFRVAYSMRRIITHIFSTENFDENIVSTLNIGSVLMLNDDTNVTIITNSKSMKSKFLSRNIKQSKLSSSIHPSFTCGCYLILL